MTFRGLRMIVGSTGALVALFALVGCHQAPAMQSELMARNPLSGPQVPHEAVRPRFREARTQDPALELGYFSAFRPRGAALALGVVSRPNERTDDGRTAETEELLRAVRSEVAPETWSLPGRHAYREGEWLIVFQTDEVLSEIEQWLPERRRNAFAGKPTFEQSLTLVSLARNEEPTDWTAASEGAQPPTVIAVSDATLQTVLSSAGTTTITSPRVRTHDGQKAAITVADSRAYLTFPDVFRVDGQRICDPTIAIFQSGVVAELTATSAGDGARVELELHRVELDELEDQRYVLRDGQFFDYQIPRFREWRVPASFDADLGQTYAIRGGDDGARRLWLFYRAER